MGYQSLSINKASTFLVTGGAGFIGSNLCEAILKLGFKVRCLDNLSTGHRENFDEFLNHPNFTFIEGDILSYNICDTVCEDVDFVLHHAALASVPQSIEQPLLYDEVNATGTLNMLEAAKKNKVKKFVYASSSAIYGEDPGLPKKEHQKADPISPYALTKKMNEDMAKLYSNIYGVDTYGLRYFNVFGKRQDPKGAYAAVIPKFIQLLLNDERPVIHGDGLQSRDFVFVENVIEANLRACCAPSSVAGGVFNVGNGVATTLIELYEILAKMLNRENLAPDFGPERAGDIKHSYADISKARDVLGYDPSWSFADGLKETLDWYVAQV